MSATPRLERGVVTRRTEIMPGVWQLRLHSPAIARDGEPGQFVHIQCADTSDPLLRRPFSFCDINPGAGTYDILFNVVGAGTALLAGAEAGQAFEALGPLGHSFTLPPAGTVLAIGGGLGVAPFPLLSRAARAAGLTFRFLNGAYTAHQLLPPAMLAPGVELHQCTEDGSAGRAGFVTDASAALFEGCVAVYACGPMPMLNALARQLAEIEEQEAQVPRCEMSLEAPMGCALGTCLGCVVPSAGGGYARVCVEGAVFDWRALDWDRTATLSDLVYHRSTQARLPAEASVGAEA